MATVTGGPWPRAHLNSPANTYYQARPVITFAPSLVTRHWGRVPSVHGIYYPASAWLIQLRAYAMPSVPVPPIILLTDMVTRCRLLAAHGATSCLSVRTQPLTATGAPSQTSTIPYHTIPWVCYRRRNQWLRLALALFCLPLIWLARVVYLLVGVAEGCGGWRGHAYPCAVTGYAMLRYSVGVGVGFLRGVLCQKDERLRISFGAVGCDVCWGVGVGGGLVGVGLGLLRFAGGIKVAAE